MELAYQNWDTLSQPLGSFSFPSRAHTSLPLLLLSFLPSNTTAFVIRLLPTVGELHALAQLVQSTPAGGRRWWWGKMQSGGWRWAKKANNNPCIPDEISGDLTDRDSTWNPLFSNSSFQPYPDWPLKVTRKIPRFSCNSKLLELYLGQTVVILEVMIPDYWSWWKILRNDIYCLCLVIFWNHAFRCETTN